MDKHLLKSLFVTYKPCHIYVAFFHLGNLSKLTSEENILWNHWDLHKLKHNKFNYMLALRINKYYSQAS